jgi:hypothetical protein
MSEPSPANPAGAHFNGKILGSQAYRDLAVLLGEVAQLALWL